MYIFVKVEYLGEYNLSDIKDVGFFQCIRPFKAVAPDKNPRLWKAGTNLVNNKLIWLIINFDIVT